MSRIPGIDADAAGGYIGRVLAAQAEIWGAPLNNHLLYARWPDLFRAVRGMWSSLGSGELLDAALVALVNRRVASLNGCVF